MNGTKNSASETPNALASRQVAVTLTVVASPGDPRTIELWASHLGVGPGTLKTWCYTAGFSPKRSLNLARMLRVVVRKRDTGVRPQDLLDVVDRRTLTALVKAAGVSSGQAEDLPGDADVLLAQQTFIRTDFALAAITRVLRERGA